MTWLLAVMRQQISEVSCSYTGPVLRLKENRGESNMLLFLSRHVQMVDILVFPTH